MKSPTPPRQQCASPYRSASWAALLGRPTIDGPRREQPQTFTTGMVIARVVRRSLGSWRDSYRPIPMEPAVSALSHGSVEDILCARGGVGMPRTAHTDPSVCSKTFTTVVKNPTLLSVRIFAPLLGGLARSGHSTFTTVSVHRDPSGGTATGWKTLRLGYTHTLIHSQSH